MTRIFWSKDVREFVSICITYVFISLCGQTLFKYYSCEDILFSPHKFKEHLWG